LVGYHAIDWPARKEIPKAGLPFDSFLSGEQFRTAATSFDVARRLAMCSILVGVSRARSLA